MKGVALLTFANPIFLAGLLAAGVPVVMHLLRGERATRTVFPAAMLLVSSAEVRQRRKSIAEILLLILRVLVVAGFVLALARPRVAAWGPSEEQKILASVAVVVDDTPSMGVRGSGPEGATRMARARSCVLGLLDHLEPGSRVRVETASRLVLDGAVDLEEVRRAAEGLRPAEAAVGLAGAVADSVKWLAEEAPPRELYVISDFQRSSWEGARRMSLFSDVRVHYVDLGKRPPRDAGVAGVRVIEDRIYRGVPFEIRARVRSSFTGTCKLALRLAGRVERRKSVRLRAGEEAEFSFDLAVPEAGPVVGEFVLEGTDDRAVRDRRNNDQSNNDPRNDDWPDNDTRRFALEVLPAPRVLCVGAGSGEGRLAGDVLALAFSPFPVGERELARVRKTQAPLPEEAELARFDCVVLASPSAVPERDWPRLARFVEDGGGLLAFADDGMGEAAFWQRTGTLLPAKSARLVARGEPSRLVRLELDHPVLSTFAEGANGNLGLAAFRRFLDFHVRWGGSGAVKALAHFSNTRPEVPALLSSRRGRGRVLLFGSSPAQGWGTFFREPSFVPFAHEAVSHLARAEAALRVVLAGERVRVTLGPAERGSEASLADRSSDPPVVRRLEVDPEGLVVRLGRLEKRGVFHLVTRSPESERTRALAVELDARELDHGRIDPKRLLGMASAGVESAGELGASIARTRGGIDVSGHVLWAVLLLFVAEMLLASRLTRRRSNAPGAGPNTEGAI